MGTFYFVYLCDVDTTCFRAELKSHFFCSDFRVWRHFVVFLEGKLKLREAHSSKSHRLNQLNQSLCQMRKNQSASPNE